MAAEQEMRSGLVDRLVDRLTDLDDAPATRPPAFVVRGAPGMGKSQLLRDVAARLGDEGVPVRRASGGEAQRHLAFGALLHLLPPTASPVTVEFELIQRLRGALVEQAATAVLIIDDISLLDDRSAGLIESVLLHGDVALLASERTTVTGVASEHALSSTLRAQAESIRIPPLTPSESAALLDEWLGAGEVGSVRWMSEMSQGNPFVLHAIVASARAGGSIGERDGLWYLREFPRTDISLERLVTEHLELSESEWELLRCFAVAGSLPRCLAARIDEESLERLERDDLVRGDPCEIAHPLYADVIVDSLSAEQVRRVSAKLVTSAVPDDAVDPARLGSWSLRADVGVDVDIARRGAAAALARWENGLARDLLATLAEPTADDLVQLQWAHANAGDLAEAASAADRAVEAAETDQDRVGAGLARAELWALQMNRRDDAYDALVSLRDAIDDPALLARIDGATALYSHVTGNRELAETAARAAAAGAGDLDDPEVRLAVLIGHAFDRLFAGRFEAASAAVAEGLPLAEGPGQRHNWVRLRIAEALIDLFIGDLEGAREVVADALRLADLSGIRPAHVVWLGLDAQLAQIRGDFVRAESRAREAIRAGDHVDDFGAAGFVRGDLAALRVELGRQAELATGSSPIGLARARTRLAPADEADDVAADLAAQAAESGYEMWAPWVAREAVRRGPAPKCAELIAGWAAVQDGPVIAFLDDHASGVVAGDSGRVSGAARGLQELGYTIPALDAHAAACRMMLDRDGTTADLRRDVLHVRTLAKTVRPAVPPALASRLDAVFHAADLPSERQLEIAELAAAGRASKEIAADLIVSVRTVDNHLAAVYRKLEVNSRDELATFLHPGGDAPAGVGGAAASG